MEYKIRKTKIDDMNSVEDAHRRSIIEVCSKDYTADQIAKYSAVKYSPEVWENSVNNHFHVVVEVKGKIEGMCHARLLEDGVGEIVGLYFSRVILGKGIGREVIEMAFEYLDQFDIKKIRLTGTVTAKPFYEKMGFIEIEKLQQNIRGAMLDCFRMVKELNRINY